MFLSGRIEIEYTETQNFDFYQIKIKLTIYVERFTIVKFNVNNKKIMTKELVRNKRKEKKTYKKKKRTKEKGRKYFDRVRWSRVIYAFNT